MDNTNLYRMRELLESIQNSVDEEANKFRDVFYFSGIGMALVALDGTFIEVNGALASMLGYTPHEMKVKTFQEITHPDDLEEDLQNLQDCISGKINTYSMQKRYFHKKGHLIYIILTVSTVRDKDNNVRYFIAQIQDITNLKLTKMRLKERTDKMKDLIEMSGDIFWIIRLPDNQCIYLSEAYEKVWGRPVSEMMEDGRVWLDSIIFEDRERVIRTFDKAEGKFECIYTIERPDGTRRIIQDKAVEVENGAPGISYLYGIAKDITELSREG